MSQPTATPPHDSWRFMWGFIFLTSFAGIGIGIARVATSLYAVDLHANELQMGVISAAQSIGILFMALPVGILIQQWGATRLFVLGSTMGGVMYDSFFGCGCPTILSKVSRFRCQMLC